MIARNCVIPYGNVIVIIAWGFRICFQINVRLFIKKKVYSYVYEKYFVAS